MAEKIKYIYKDGPVYHFGNYIGNWSGCTMAVSKDQALNNLTFQCKSKCGYGRNTIVTLAKSHVKMAHEEA